MKTSGQWSCQFILHAATGLHIAAVARNRSDCHCQGSLVPLCGEEHVQQSHVDTDLGVAMRESMEKGAGDGRRVVIFR
jgi:hypothetical protein